MAANPVTTLNAAVGNAAAHAGLTVVSSEEGIDFNGRPRHLPYRSFQGGSCRADAATGVERGLRLSSPRAIAGDDGPLTRRGQRLRNPRPDAYVTMAGMPITFGDFRWPFHRLFPAPIHTLSTEWSMWPTARFPTARQSLRQHDRTFAEIVAAPEQPYAETFIYSAIRKTLDQGQLELLKSGNRQPVPVTTRYYSRWQKKFFFTDTDDESRQRFLGDQGFLALGGAGQLAAGLDR